MDKWVDLRGEWEIKDGMLHQKMIDDNCMAVVTDENWDESWMEYTFEVKAKKLSGNEGFLIMFRLHGFPEPRGRALGNIPPRMESQSPRTQYWWNLGGWGNTRSVVERWIDGVRIEQAPMEGHSVESNRWYHIKIENREDGYTLYLDGEKVADVQDSDVKGGRVGLGTWLTEAVFDDVIVYGPEGVTVIHTSGKLPSVWGLIKEVHLR